MDNILCPYCNRENLIPGIIPSLPYRCPECHHNETIHEKLLRKALVALGAAKSQISQKRTPTTYKVVQEAEKALDEFLYHNRSFAFNLGSPRKG